MSMDLNFRDASIVRILVFAGVVAQAAGCDQTCEDYGNASVSVGVVDQNGDAIKATTLTYAIDGGDEMPVECTNEDCSRMVAGWEQTGSFLIRASLSGPHATDDGCEYAAQDERTVVVVLEDDGCHVHGEAVELVLDTESVSCE